MGIAATVCMLSVISLGSAAAVRSAGAATTGHTTPTRTTIQFAGRDIYAPDVIPNPDGAGYLMWYGGWQSQQALNSGQLDTIFQRTAPAPGGPWSAPTTDILPAQVGPHVKEVNNPAVSVSSFGGSSIYTIFFTSLVCTTGCTSQVWSATSSDGNRWGSFRPLGIANPYGSDAGTGSVLLQPSGAQRWLVYFGADCLIGVASVDASRNVLSTSIIYRGSGNQCMSSPDVFQTGATWRLYFNLQEPTLTDPTRLDIWATSSSSPTDWSGSHPSPVIVVNGTQYCSALTPFVLPLPSNQLDIYYGRVVTGSFGQCDDLTQSTSIVLNGNPSYSQASALASTAQSCAALPAGSVVGIADGPGDAGYWIVDAAGQMDGCGYVPTSDGQLPAAPPSPIVGMATTPNGQGYWLVGRDGSVYAFGDARYYGSLPSVGVTPGHPVVGMVATPNGQGYWLVASDGGIFSFGNASFHGSTGGIPLNRPIVGMAVDPATGGYWLVASDGGIFAFGAPFRGSMGGTRLNRPIVGMAVDPATGGYWLVASDGGIFAFDAPFHGSTGDITLNRPIIGMESAPSGAGYRLVATDGGVFSFGSSQSYGSAV
ncbi:MAG: hypothetical protein ACYCV7_17585 [Acidimicrobiales bacterium]